MDRLMDNNDLLPKLADLAVKKDTILKQMVDFESEWRDIQKEWMGSNPLPDNKYWCFDVIRKPFIASSPDLCSHDYGGYNCLCKDSDLVYQKVRMLIVNNIVKSMTCSLIW